MIKALYILAVLAWILLLFPYPATLFMAASFACFSFPAYKRLHARWPDLRAIFAYTIGLIMMIVAPVTVLIVLVVPQARAGYNMLLKMRDAHFELPPSWLAEIEQWRTSLSFIPGLNDWVNDLGSNLERVLGEVVRTLVSGSFGFLGGTMTVGWTLLLFVTFSALCVVYASRLHTIILVSTRTPEDMLNRFVVTIRAALRGVFMGVVLVAMAQGVLCGIGFSVAGVAQPAFWGLLATIVAPIPVVGTAIVWIPLCLALWFSGSTAAAIGLAIWGTVAVAGVDNILRPLFLKSGINAPLFVLVVAILCGLSTFGPIGLIVGPVLVAFSIQAVQEADCLIKRCTFQPGEVNPELAPDAASGPIPGPALNTTSGTSSDRKHAPHRAKAK